MKKSIKGLIKLTRFNEYVYFVVITTLLGVAAARGRFGMSLIVLLIANWMAVGFAFMINDIEDAPDDALSLAKTHRNPVSAGLIKPWTARKATFAVGAISAGLFAILGFWPFIFGFSSLILGYLYSARLVRLKTMAFMDIFSHCLMLAGLQFLTGYFTYANRLSYYWFWPFIFVLSISVYGELYNELRDLEVDQQAQLRHTAIFLGEKTTHIIMLLMLFISLISGMVSFVMINLIPHWVLILMVVLALVFTLPPFLKVKRTKNNLAIQNAFHKPLERAAALALALLYILPWLDQFWRLGLF